MAINEVSRQLGYDEDFQRLVDAQRLGTLLAMQDVARDRERRRDLQRFGQMLPSYVVLGLMSALFAWHVLRPWLWSEITGFFGG